MSAAPSVENCEEPAPRGLRADTLAGGVVLLLGLTVAQRLIGFLRGVLFCRWLDAEQLGQWDLSFGFLMMAAPVALLGLPGSFGRYVEYFRQRGELRPFLRRMAVCTTLLGASAMAIAAAGKDWFSRLIFGGDDCGPLVVWLALGLGAWMAHMVLMALFNALRMTRVVSAMQFLNGVAFAALGVGLLLAWEPSAASVVAAFGAASVASSLYGWRRLRQSWGELGAEASVARESDFWRKVLPFALWVWVTNWLANLFGLADRYLLIHHSGLPEADALALVGQYHSSRIVPLLFIGVAEMLAALVTPHLMHDWEAGRREHATRRLNLMLKLFALALAAGALAVLAVSPWLFGVALGGKYAEGLAVLPWTMAACVFGSLAVVAVNYLWCAEQPKLASAAMAAALVVNVSLNLWLLPQFHLLGAALAAAAGNAALLLLTFAAAALIGLRPDRGTWTAALAPLAIGFGLWSTGAALLAIALLAISTRWMFDEAEKQTLWSAAAGGWRRFESTIGRWSKPGLVMQINSLLSRRRRRPLKPAADRGPLRVMFVITCMPVGGAETLLVNLVRRMDRSRFEPELCCLKYFGPLGETLAREIPAFTGLLKHKYDLRVFGRLTRLLTERRIDAVITVGTGGDKMFWGRLAAWRAGVPVVASALHSTGLPDHVEWLNRRLAPLTDAFIGVAAPHAQYLAEHEGCPADKVRVIPNGVDVERFWPVEPNAALRNELGLPPDVPVAAIVAALRPEKNHELFLQAAARVREKLPEARFLIIGDGERRAALEAFAAQLQLGEAVRFLGTRSDIPELLALADLLVLSSHMEANPVSILEALACGKPVVATRVGSIPESVKDGVNGYLVAPGDAEELAERVGALLADRALARQLGVAGREIVVGHWSLERMVEGYQNLIAEIYASKCPPTPLPAAAEPELAASVS
jgi:glycosyltransferase involved in cell wall biosynthesis/O-antigen/teichoic acid export membrane protein